MVYFSIFFFRRSTLLSYTSYSSLDRENINVTYTLDMHLVLLLNSHQS